MKTSAPGRIALALVLVCAVACGKKGDPLPPIQVLPQPASAVKLSQHGNVVRLTYTVPSAMTDGSPPPVLEVRLQQAIGPGDFPKIARKSAKQAAPGEVLTEEWPLPAPGTAVRVSIQIAARGRLSNPTPVLSLVARERVEIPASMCVEAWSKGTRIEWAAIKPPPPVRTLVTSTGKAITTPVAQPTPSPTPPASPAPDAPPTTPASGAAPTPSPSPPAVTYRLFRRSETGAYATPLTPAPIPATFYEDEQAPTEATSCYVVRAVVSAEPLVESEDSREVCLRLEDVEAPPTPTGATAFVRDRNVEVVWDAVGAADLAGYRVMRAPVGKEAILLKEVDAATTSFTDTTAEPGVVYHYTVVAFDKAGNASAPTEPAQAGTQ